MPHFCFSRALQAPVEDNVGAVYGSFCPQLRTNGLNRHLSLHIVFCRYDDGVKNLVLLARAMADFTRVRILYALRGRDLCVCELCDALEVSQSTLSTHLQVIREAGLVQTRKEGKWIYYAPAPDFESLTTGIFDFFDSTLCRDARLQRDGNRIKKRLAERTDGECCRGFEQKCCSPSRKTK